MPTLTYVTTKTKSILKWLSISLVYFSILFAVIKIGVAIKERTFPTPPPPAEVTFGKLPAISFPKSAVEKKLTYSLDTITGFLPVLPPNVEVYKMAQLRPQFLALDIARQKAALAGFRSSEARLSESWYRWLDQSYPSREITFNIFSNNFSISSPFLSDPLAPLLVSSFANQDIAINQARKLLSETTSSFPGDLDLRLTKTLYYSIREDGSLKPETLIANTQVIRVDFFQKRIDDLPIYYPNATISTINVLIANIQNRPIVIGANFNHQPISDLAHTYPTKTAAEAFLELKDNKAYIASYFGDKTNVAIKNVFLGYYMGEKKHDFLMPIVFFEGDNGFFAYVSAVKDEWINK